MFKLDTLHAYTFCIAFKENILVDIYTHIQI